MNNIQYLTTKALAKIVRNRLGMFFTGQDFSVQCASCWEITIKWVDGPSDNAVHEVLDPLRLEKYFWVIDGWSIVPMKPEEEAFHDSFLSCYKNKELFCEASVPKNISLRHWYSALKLQDVAKKFLKWYGVRPSIDNNKKEVSKIIAYNPRYFASDLGLEYRPNYYSLDLDWDMALNTLSAKGYQCSTHEDAKEEFINLYRFYRNSWGKMLDSSGAPSTNPACCYFETPEEIIR